jgi:hypothetical protein
MLGAADWPLVLCDCDEAPLLLGLCAPVWLVLLGLCVELWSLLVEVCDEELWLLLAAGEVL